MTGVQEFLAARDLLLELRTDVDAARERFRWPSVDGFNWALDYFDRVDHPDRRALWIVGDDGGETARSYGELSARSNQVANLLHRLGMSAGDRLLVMLGNTVSLWEVTLAAVKLGVVVIPSTLLLGTDDLIDRLERGHVKGVVTDASVADRFTGLAWAGVRLAANGDVDGWTPYAEADAEPATLAQPASTTGTDPLFLYFTSGTTSKPKLVEHTHASYPIGHLSTMYVLGLQPGDVHLNISSPGWAKHAWSCLFAPLTAGATVFVHDYARFDAEVLLDVLRRGGVTTFCAPPTVWRLLIQHDLAAHRDRLTLREVLAAGEPLNPEIIEQVRGAWDLTVRDFYGQTETTAQIGNPPGLPVKLGSMGRPLPGYPIVLVDADGNEAEEGEICIDLAERPVGLMVGYQDDPDRTEQVMEGGRYHTGDVASCDADGYLTYVGRTDDVFKASDYRISPFELESALLEHPAVAEAAVVPSPDPVRLAVPKAFVVLTAGWAPDAATAAAIFAFSRDRLAPYKRIRRLQFAELPKTISGKIRRVELRQGEHDRPIAEGERAVGEFWEVDFPELRA